MQVHFHFTSQLVTSDNTFPRAMQNLISNLPVRELDLAFVHGRWVRLTAACYLLLADSTQPDSSALVMEKLCTYKSSVDCTSVTQYCSYPWQGYVDCSSLKGGVSRPCL